MARTATKPKPKTTAKLPPGSPLKKPVGRPRGSGNKMKAEPERKLPAASVSKRQASVSVAVSARGAPAAAKMSKADLEARLVKLERALARSRKQVAELKLMVSNADAQSEIDKRPPEPVAKVAKGKPVMRKPVAARGRKKAGPVEQDEPVFDEAESEAHAS